MIAMALVCRPALLIADEPTTALDVTIQAQILQLLHDLQSELHMAVLLITHDLGVVANMAEEVVVIYHGELLESGTLDDIFRDPRHPYLRALMRAVPRVGMRAGERLTPLREVARVEGGHLGAGPDAATEERFAIRSSGWFGSDGEGSVQALDDVSFDIRRGECLGLVGESGCGKTTVSKIILRALDPDAGRVDFDDGSGMRSLLTLDDDALVAMRRRIQYIFQDPVSSLNPRMTVFDIISEPLIIHKVSDAAGRAEIVKELMRHVGLDPRFLSRYPHSFSGGQRQRIGIARALALNPELIICDEPVSALDVSVQAQVLNLLKDLQESLGLTYLFISHNLAVVDYMADRIAVMCAGYLVEMAPRELLFQNPVHPYTRALLAAVPRPDPDRKLDLGALMEGKVSQPSAWEPPFGVTADERPDLLDLGDGHYVRAAPLLLGEA
jgi:peptide/nickel transport system ATP-binding protein